MYTVEILYNTLKDGVHGSEKHNNDMKVIGIHVKCKWLKKRKQPIIFSGIDITVEDVLSIEIRFA